MADLDVAEYEEIQLQGRDNVVFAQMQAGKGPEYQGESAQEVPLLVGSGLTLYRTRHWTRRGEGLCMMWRRSIDKQSESTAMSHMGGGSRTLWLSYRWNMSKP